MGRKDKGNYHTQGHSKILEKDVDTPTEDKAENYEDKIKIYEENSKVWDSIIIILTDILFGLVRHCDESENEAWKDLIEKYEVTDEKQDILNEVTNKWNNFRIKETSQDPYSWFNELYNLNLKFKSIKEKYKKYEDKLKANIFDVLPE